MFSADPLTGVTMEVDLGGADLIGGNGLVLRGRTLFVPTNPSSDGPGRTAVVGLSGDLTSGSVVRWRDEPGLDISTTLALTGGGRLVAVDLRDGALGAEPEYALAEMAR